MIRFKGEEEDKNEWMVDIRYKSMLVMSFTIYTDSWEDALKRVKKWIGLPNYEVEVQGRYVGINVMSFHPVLEMLDREMAIIEYYKIEESLTLEKRCGSIYGSGKEDVIMDMDEIGEDIKGDLKKGGKDEKTDWWEDEGLVG